MTGARIDVDGRSVGIEHAAKVVLDLGLLLVVLMDPDSYIPKFGQFRNLIAIRRSGDEVWKAELPTSTTGDCFLAAEQFGADRLRARSFSSYEVTIDALTGRIEEKEFAK